MKSILFILLMLFGTMVYGQSDSVETAILNKKYLSKEILRYDYNKILTSWGNTIKSFKGYPAIPVDKNGDPYYSFTNSYTDIEKEKLFKRTLEWLSVNYGLLPSYVYSDREDGRIIFRNSISLTDGNSCYYTCIISIKDGKMLSEYLKLEYQKFSAGYYSGDTWNPENTVTFTVKQIYPIILKKESKWIPNLNLLKATNDFFNSDNMSLYDYISNYNSSYQF